MRIGPMTPSFGQIQTDDYAADDDSALPNNSKSTELTARIDDYAIDYYIVPDTLQETELTTPQEKSWAGRILDFAMATFPWLGRRSR